MTSSFYDAVGEETFRAIVHEFYRQVRTDDILGPMYPEQDFEGAEDRLRWFLVQYWGGPAEFNARRGHPRLRMRHAPFPVTPKSRDHWLGHMRRALDQLNLPPMYDSLMWDYFQRAATAMLNTPDEDSDEHRIDPSRRLL